jgi:hypothetical protein
MRYLINTIFLFFSVNVYSQAVPFETAKKIDSGFYSAISVLKKTFAEEVLIFPNSEPVFVELYTNAIHDDANGNKAEYENDLEQDNDEGEYIWKAILKIGEYYHSFELGLYYTFELKNVAGSKNSEKEIVIDYGCLWQDPCLPQLNIVRIFKDAPFTFTYFSGDISRILERSDAMIKNEYDKYKKMGCILVSFYHWNEPRCFDENAAYSISGKGFKKIWSKRKRRECAG